MSRQYLSELSVDHVEFHVADAAAGAADLIDRYGFALSATSGSRDGTHDHYSLALRQGDITLVMTEARSEQHPADSFVQSHGGGVANIALRTSDARAALGAAVGAGARVVAEPTEVDGFVTAAISGFGDVIHTFVQRPGDNASGLPGFTPVAGAGQAGAGTTPDLLDIDHFAVCLAAGQLDEITAFYESVLDFSVVFEERIQVGSQAMLSKVVQSASQHVTLTLIQSDPDGEAGQLDDFLKDNNGPGVQHVALRADNIVHSVGALRDRGVEFLNAPGAYYRLLSQRLELVTRTVQSLENLDILVDEDHYGQLFQIFTRSTHPRRTFFFEVIERLGAKTFGSGNIRALYEAVETERIKGQEYL